MNLKKTLSVIRPVTVTDAMLTTNVVAEGHPAWNSGTAFSVSDRTVLNNLIYEAATDNTNKNPPDYPEDWIEVSSTNPWRMFDGSGGSQTERDDSIVVSIQLSSLVNSVAFLECECNTIQVVMTAPAEGIVYDKTINMIDYGVSNWYDYYFEPVPRKFSSVALDLPPYRTALLTVTFSYPGSTARVGNMVFGALKRLGTTEYGVKIRSRDYSQKTTSQYGRSTILKGEAVQLMRLNFIVENQDVADVIRFMTRFHSVPTVWIGAEHRVETILYAIFIDHSAEISNPTFSKGDLELEGIIV